MSGKEDYIKNLQVDDLIAFSLSDLEAKMYSGKITKLGKTRVEVETKNGKKYFVDKTNIHWINTTGKWPIHIIKALKGVDTETETESMINISNEEENLLRLNSGVSEDIIIEDENGIIVDIIESEE